MSPHAFFTEHPRSAVAALESTASAVVVTDLQGYIIWGNEAFATITGYALLESIGRKMGFLGSGVHEDAFFAEMWTAIGSGGTWRGQITNRRKDGSLFVVEEVITPVRGRSGKTEQFVAVFNDLTGQLALRESGRTFAYFDRGTGLPNEQHFQTYLELDLVRATNAGDTQIIVALIMLDRISVVSEGLGARAADEVLRLAADRTVPRLLTSERLAVLDNGRFALELHGDLGTTSPRLEAMLHLLEKPYLVEGQIVFTGACAGLAEANASVGDAEAIIRNAQAALSRARLMQTAPRMALYDSGMHTHSAKVLRMEADLRHAHATGQLNTLYQPIVELSSMRLRALECLMRWTHSTEGPIPPPEFIGLAETVGLIGALCEAQIHAALTQRALWPGGASAKPILNVNLSPRQPRRQPTESGHRPGADRDGRKAEPEGDRRGGGD